MITVRGIYDGEKFVALEDFPKEKPYKIIITFLEELNEEDQLRDFSAQTNGLGFWKAAAEDLYQDYLNWHFLAPGIGQQTYNE